MREHIGAIGPEEFSRLRADDNGMPTRREPDYSDPVSAFKQVTAPYNLFPNNSAGRKEYPIASGLFDYFPAALAAVAHVSFNGNQQHNPGEPLHWARGKSDDHADTLQRHFLERGQRDSDGQWHAAKMAWRALAILQLLIEKEEGAPTAPGVK